MRYAAASARGGSVRPVTDPVARQFPAAAELAGALVTDPAVAARWADESACPGMTVGGLAHHLAGQGSSAVRLLTTAPTADEPIPLLEHYRRAAWVRSAPDEEANTGIRDDSNESAVGGPAVLADLVSADLAALPGALAPVLAGERAPDTVHIPWQGWSLSTDDFLITRLMEIVVHSDDLAASVELQPPTWPDAVLAPVLALLSGVAVERHGQAAVVRALSRPQRAPASVSAF
jgi:hypothetical protein